MFIENIALFSVDGKYTEWTEWSTCDKTCGNGTKYRSRTCQNPPPVGGGRNCLEQNLGPAEESAPCMSTFCPGMKKVLLSLIITLEKWKIKNKMEKKSIFMK